MNRALSFAKLDYITIKPYLTLKNLFLFSIVALFMMITWKNTVSAIAMLMVYSSLYVSYPFAVGDKNGIDALYTSLSINRITVVNGRYLFAFIFNACAGILSFIYSILVSKIMKYDFNLFETVLSTLALFFVFSIVQAIQLPLYFKLGYTKAKFYSYIPFLGLPLIALVLSNFLKDKISINQIADISTWVEANQYITLLIGVIFWLILMIISLQVSQVFYKKREF